MRKYNCEVNIHVIEHNYVFRGKGEIISVVSRPLTGHVTAGDIWGTTLHRGDEKTPEAFCTLWIARD